MQIVQLIARNFRSFEELTLRPAGHVVLLGPPGMGRSNLIEALSRVLDPDMLRRSVGELDFHARRTDQPISIELVLGHLGPQLEQTFLDQLELWDNEEGRVVEESATVEAASDEEDGISSWVLRLCYMARWLAEENRGEHWVHFPKFSDPEVERYEFARRSEVQRLPFERIDGTTGRPLDLSERSAFRRLVTGAAGTDFSEAVSQYVEGVGREAGVFAKSEQVLEAMEKVLDPLRLLLGLGDNKADEIVRFAPEGGAPSGLLRSLAPSLHLGRGPDFLPANRQGATVTTVLRFAEALALVDVSNGILAVDDLGDGMDAAAATHLASIMQGLGGQVLITTRLAPVAEMFGIEEIVRLDQDDENKLVAYQGRNPTSRTERVAARQWSRVVLPVLTFDAVAVVEGPFDLAALHGLSMRLMREGGVPLMASRRISFVSAGAMDSGGASSVPRIAKLAAGMGMRTVAVIDGDKNQEGIIEEVLAAAQAVVRLPDKMAIERVLVEGLPDDVLRAAIRDTASAAAISEPDNLDDLDAVELRKAAASILKYSGGLHSLFIDVLPLGILPSRGIELLEAITRAVVEKTEGLIQL
ncbi:MAG: hypothetical protein WEB04_07045 [Dehalococcoidia bacterium]